MRLSLIFLTFFLIIQKVFCQDFDYKLGSDSKRQTGVPEVVVTKYEWESQICGETTFSEYTSMCPRSMI